MPSLSSFGALRKALHAALDNEGGDAARAGGGIGLGVDDERLGDGAVGDPHLRAIEHEAVALALGARRHRYDVGACVRLRHRQRPDVLAGDELGQIARLLLVIAVAHDLVDAEVRMRAVRQPDRSRGARDFLHRHAMLEVAQGQPAIFLRRRDPVQAERAHLGPQVARKQVVAVDLPRRAARSPSRRRSGRCRGSSRRSRRGRSRRDGARWGSWARLRGALRRRSGGKLGGNRRRLARPGPGRKIRLLRPPPRGPLRL